MVFFENKRALKNLYFVIGCLVFAALFVMAWMFYLERVCLADTAYRTVIMLLTGRPAIFPLRFGAFIPQLLPLSAIWLHASLKTVMVVNSLSFVVFFFCVYLVAYRISGSSLMFFLVPVYLIMLTNEEFYWPQSEYQQGMVWLCLYAVVLIARRFESYRVWPFFLIHALCIFWIQTFHPLIFIPLFFLVVYFYSTYSQLAGRRFFIHAGICIAAFIVRYIEGKNNYYESGKLNIAESAREHLPQLFSVGSVIEFWHKLPLEYAGYAIAFLITLTWFIYTRKYLLVAVFVSFSVFYWLLVIMACPGVGRFYSEYLMLPLGFMAALPVVAEVIPRFQGVYTVALILIFCTARIATIYHSHIDYTGRLDIYQPYFKYVRSHGLNGVFVDAKLTDEKKIIMSWGSGYESLLLSSLRSPDSSMVVQIDADVSRYRANVNDTASLVTIFGAWPKRELPAEYFRLRGGKYEVIDKKQDY